MRITQIVLRNFQCYKGEHILNLEAKAYAIVARHTEDQDRSNWLGKSSLFEAIQFALFGDHRHLREDDWITNGEEAGSIELRFDTGECITRGRNRGERTTLVFIDKDNRELRKDDAQQAIESLIGVGRHEFATSCYFEQKYMARFILATSSERAELVTRWFGLEKLVECEEHVDHDLSELIGRERMVDMELVRLRAKIGVLVEGGDEAFLSDQLQLSLEKTDHLEKEFVWVKETMNAYAGLHVRKNRKAEYESIVARGIELKQKLLPQERVVSLRARRSEIELELHDLTPELIRTGTLVETAKSLSTGEFNGVCPLMGQECPARDRVFDARNKSVEAFATLNKEYKRVARIDVDLKNELIDVATTLQDHEETDASLARLREVALALKKQGVVVVESELQTFDELVSRSQELSQEFASITGRVREIQSLLQKISEVRKEIEKLIATQQDLHTRKKMLLAAKKVFGRTGAFKLLAEQRLKSIELLANDILQRCGVTLSVALIWSYEGQGLASHCEACGQPFPVSAKVKVCDACTTSRGNKVVRRLQVNLSDRSGAAEDLAGIAIQLAASSCLRSWRGIQWGVLMLDEPFGSLDSAHRRAVASHLARLLGEVGAYTQSFTIAHHSAILDALPGRIEIVSNGSYSWVNVVA